MTDSTVFAVASAKGGVGKTTTSINLGTAIAAHDLDVVVVELDLAMANVVDFLSLDFDDQGDPSMHDVLTGDAPVTDALYDAPGGATVAPSGTSLAELGSIDLSHLPDAVAALEAEFDVVVLDTGAGVNSATTSAVQVADQTLLVSTPRVASIRDTDKTRTIVEQRGGEVGGLLLTQAGTGSSPGSEHLGEFLGVDLLGTVPKDSVIPRSQDAGVPVVERRPDSEVAEAYAEAAATLAERAIERRAQTDVEPSEPEGPETERPEPEEPAAETAESETIETGASVPLTHDTESPAPEARNIDVDVPETNTSGGASAETQDAVTAEAASAGQESPPSEHPEPETVDGKSPATEPAPDDGRHTERKAEEHPAGPPSRETLKAEGWTFPGGQNREQPAGPERADTDGSTQDFARGTRQVSSDGGAGPGQAETDSTQSSATGENGSDTDQLPADIRADGTDDADSSETPVAKTKNAEESSPSLLGVISSLFDRFR